ncbi:MAG TPA: SprB repeat-containing protein, partial [Bacteroidia bacterium]|nr:SprB repeat-containing protein [Bacteroidia bacterium]
ASFPKVGPNQVGTVDAPAAMLPNGHILCAVSPVGISPSEEFRAPTYFFEYDYTTNTFAQVTSVLPSLGVDSLKGINCDFTTFLLLPTGQVLLGINQQHISKQYWIYTPGSGPIPEGIPVVNSVYQTTCGANFFITGKLFNGISEGAAFGDDWQMSTNYPLVRLSNGTNTYYCKTTNWNRIGAVQTDSLEDTAQFALPAGLPPGNYSLYVVVNGFPSSPFPFTPFAVSDSIIANVSCHGDSNGNLKAIVFGGVSPYTYAWSNATTTASISNPTGAILSAGTYTVTVTDSLGCTLTASAIITQPTVLTASITISANVSCNADSNGKLTSTVSGGTTPYTYSWTNGVTSAANSGLSAGSYTLTVTDKNGCSATATASITQPTALGISATTNNNILCTGDNSGSVSSVASGGTSPYTYSWSGGGTNSNKTGLTAGTYTITLTDKHGCTATASTVITQPANALSATTSITQA